MQLPSSRMNEDGSTIFPHAHRVGSSETLGRQGRGEMARVGMGWEGSLSRASIGDGEGRANVDVGSEIGALFSAENLEKEDARIDYGW